jgi:predicted transcriptional regulator
VGAAATAAAGEQRVTPLAVRCTPVTRLGSGELENQVLDVVWGATGAVTPRQVHEELSRHRKLAYTTVMTILVRLCKKGLLEREPAGRAFAYRPRISREERAAARMNDALTSAGDPSLALTHFVESLPPDQVDDLRSALRQADSDQ